MAGKKHVSISNYIGFAYQAGKLKHKLKLQLELK